MLIGTFESVLVIIRSNRHCSETDQRERQGVNSTSLCGFSEKEKWSMQEKKMMETVCYRDGRIEELERQCSQQSDEISQLVARLCVMSLNVLIM